MFLGLCSSAPLWWSTAPVKHSPMAGWDCRRVDGPRGPPPVWPAGTRASASVSGRGYWGPFPYWSREKQLVRLDLELIFHQAPHSEITSGTLLASMLLLIHFHIWIIHMASLWPSKLCCRSLGLTVVISFFFFFISACYLYVLFPSSQPPISWTSL